MNYHIEIRCLEAIHRISQLEDEPDEDFAARLKDAEGKWFLRATISDVTNGQWSALETPYHLDPHTLLPGLFAALTDLLTLHSTEPSPLHQ